MRSRNRKRRAYDLVKTAFRLHLRLRPVRFAYGIVKTVRFSESEAEAAEELNQSQTVGTCIVIGLFLLLCFPPCPALAMKSRVSSLLS